MVTTAAIDNDFKTGHYRLAVEELNLNLFDRYVAPSILLCVNIFYLCDIIFDMEHFKN